MGSMYAAVLFLGVQNATSVQPVVAVERTVFYRERAAGMYSALPYAFGQVDKLFFKNSVIKRQILDHKFFFLHRLWLNFRIFSFKHLSMES